jgi:hypothetical protein
MEMLENEDVPGSPIRLENDNYDYYAEVFYYIAERKPFTSARKIVVFACATTVNKPSHRHLTFCTGSDDSRRNIRLNSLRFAKSSTAAIFDCGTLAAGKQQSPPVVWSLVSVDFY